MIANNTADADNNNSSGHGGGIYANGTIALRNTIVAGNFDNLGSAGTGTKHPDISGSVQGNAYNLISDLTGASGTIGTGSDLPGAPANLGPLAFNGGPTQTHALLPGSAAINAGLTVLIGTDLSDSDGDGNTGEPIPFDQRGPGYVRVSGSSVDIGAFEFSPSLVVNDPSTTEGNSGTKNLTFTVSLTAPVSQTVTVNYATSNGTALAGSDYTPTSGILSFTPGEISKTVNVSMIGDTVVEQNETVFLNLSSAANAPISKSRGQGTILNDDNYYDDLTTPMFRLRNNSLPGTYLFVGEPEAISIAQNPAFAGRFTNEGFAFAVASAPTDPLLRPFYRFANIAPGRQGTYLFVGQQEAEYIVNNIPSFRLDGVAFYALDAGAGGGSINFSRFQNLSVPGTYLFTGPSESASLMSNPNFRLDGLAFAAGG
jgi:predicted outer membrane repeat protein